MGYFPSALPRRFGVIRATIRPLVAIITALIVFFGFVGPALADSFTPTDMEVSVDRNTVTKGFEESITTTFSFCVPSGQAAGDSFTMTMPGVLTNWPASFGVTNAGGEVVIDVTISDATPAVGTFTLTDIGASTQNLCASVDVDASTGDSEAGEYPLDYEVGGEVLNPENPTLTILDSNHIAPTEFKKKGWFSNLSDQCRTDTTDCLIWSFETPVGDHGVVELTDLTQPNWEFTCPMLRALKVTYNPDGTRSFETLGLPPSMVSNPTCSATELGFTIDTTGLADDESYNFRFYGNALAPGGDGAVTYSNDATVTGDGDPILISGTAVSGFVGGTADGDGITIIKLDAIGNDANTHETAVELPDGSTQLVFRVRNVGTTDLTDLDVTDTVTEGAPPATVSDISCDFSMADPNAATAGTTWVGPFAPGAQFECTAELANVSGFSTDVAEVTATGNGPVEDSDPYVAFTPNPVSVGDSVWIDVNRDGTQDDGEDPVSGVTVNLYDSEGNLVDSTTTDDNGFYSFTDLDGGDDYEIEFVTPDGHAFTSNDTGSDDTIDSDADTTTGRVSFTAPETGSNSATSPDDPTIDAGLIQINLTLAKELMTAGPFDPEATVTFILTPHNDGPVDALAGWSVTDLSPSGLTLTAMTGDGYTCDAATATCTAAEALAAGADGSPIIVEATIDTDFVGTLHNVAYISPSTGETTETNSLAIPDTTTDTDTTDTDNDAQADLTVENAAVAPPAPTPAPTPTATPAPTPTPVPTVVARPPLARTGQNSGSLAGLALALILIGAGALLVIEGQKEAAIS